MGEIGVPAATAEDTQGHISATREDGFQQAEDVITGELFEIGVQEQQRLASAGLADPGEDGLPFASVSVVDDNGQARVVRGCGTSLRRGAVARSVVHNNDLIEEIHLHNGADYSANVVGLVEGGDDACNPSLTAAGGTGFELWFGRGGGHQGSWRLLGHPSAGKRHALFRA
jgi:hypothetical protein